jgi:hypothetical protein
MTPPNKPEWIQLAETDSAPQVKKSARALPALVLATAMSIVGLGALVAQNGAETSAISSEQGINLSAASAIADPATTSAISTDVSTSLPNTTSVIQPGTPQLPGIATLPTGGGDDEDEDDDYDDDDEGDEDDEDDEDDDH